MLKFSGVLIGLAGAVAAMPLIVSPAAAIAAPVGPDAEICRKGDSPSVLVHIPAFKARSGKVRVQIYGNNPAEFLAKGQYLKRIDLPVSGNGPMEVCVGLPNAGNFAVAVRHDMDGNGKSGWSDGGGFSRNPGLSLMKLKPDYKDVVITVGQETRVVNVVLNYRQGLAIKPLKS